MSNAFSLFTLIFVTVFVLTIQSTGAEDDRVILNRGGTIFPDAGNAPLSPLETFARERQLRILTSCIGLAWIRSIFATNQAKNPKLVNGQEFADTASKTVERALDYTKLRFPEKTRSALLDDGKDFITGMQKSRNETLKFTASDLNDVVCTPFLAKLRGR